MKRNYQTPAMMVVRLRTQQHILTASENLSGANSVNEGTAGARGGRGSHSDWNDED